MKIILYEKRRRLTFGRRLRFGRRPRPDCCRIWNLSILCRGNRNNVALSGWTWNSRVSVKISIVDTFFDGPIIKHNVSTLRGMLRGTGYRGAMHYYIIFSCSCFHIFICLFIYSFHIFLYVQNHIWIWKHRNETITFSLRRKVIHQMAYQFVLNIRVHFFNIILDGNAF